MYTLRDHIPYGLPTLLQIENSHENVCVIIGITFGNTFVGYLHKTIYIYIFFFFSPTYHASVNADPAHVSHFRGKKFESREEF